MNNTDPGKKCQQFVETYSKYNDEALEELASNSDDLTELARIALELEMEKRGLTVEWANSSPETNEEEPELRTIRLFRDLPKALIAKGVLEGSGIECYLADANLVRLDWFISNAIGNMRLQVKREDAEVAIEILDNPVDAIPDDQEN